MGGSDYKQSTPSNSGKRHQGLKNSTYRRWTNQLQRRLTKWESIGLLPNSSWLVMQYQIVWRVTLFMGSHVAKMQESKDNHSLLYRRP